MHLKLKSIGTMIVLAGFAVLPFAKADEWNQETDVSINEPLEIPGGRVLPAGNYVFRLADNDSDRNIVQIFNQDKTQLITTILGIPAYRPEPTSDSAITVREEPGGNPEAISRWFFAGDTKGVGFVYPGEQ